MPDARLYRTRAAYDGGVCGVCGERMDATICKCADDVPGSFNALYREARERSHTQSVNDSDRAIRARRAARDAHIASLVRAHLQSLDDIE